jgi:hypothetical protein
MDELLIAIGIILLIGIYFYMKRDNIEPSIIEEISIKKNPIFIEAATFSGRKNGYVFKLDTQGLGYYLDKK